MIDFEELEELFTNKPAAKTSMLFVQQIETRSCICIIVKDSLFKKTNTSTLHISNETSDKVAFFGKG